VPGYLGVVVEINFTFAKNPGIRLFLCDSLIQKSCELKLRLEKIVSEVSAFDKS